MFFSLGGAATTTMVTAILPSMTASKSMYRREAEVVPEGPHSPSLSSETTMTPSRFALRASSTSIEGGTSPMNASPNRLAGLVGMFTGLGALIALGVFLPLPARFQVWGYSAEEALSASFYVVGIIAAGVALICFAGLRGLNGESGKHLHHLFARKTASEELDETTSFMISYWKLFSRALVLGYRRPAIGLGYLGGFVARASSVAISLFIPVYVNAFFQSTGRCQIDDATNVKSDCRDAYILAAKLAGVSQLVALICAPLFGFLADGFSRFNAPLLVAAVCGIVGYSAFANLSTPLTDGPEGSLVIYVFVSLLGISQIGAIVCSLGSLAQGLTSDEHASTHHSTNHLEGAQQNIVVNHRGDESWMSHRDGSAARNNHDENTPLLGKQSPRKSNMVHLKGSVAGVYSLVGGAGILLLTKLGGFLFDTWSTSAPFYMLAIFNIILLIGGVLNVVVPHLRTGREAPKATCSPT